MRIERVKVQNYRNIDGITICFNPESNYIIGENNLGKSGLPPIFVPSTELVEEAS